MPAIFNDNDRDQLYRAMIEAGWDMLVREGVDGLRVERVTQAAGIAKGTFYRFFPSKAEFISAMMSENRKRTRQPLLDLCARQGFLTREGLRAWYLGTWHNSRNVYRIFTAEKYLQLTRGLPPERRFDSEEDEEFARWLIAHARPARPSASWRTLLNIQRATSLAVLSRELLYQDALEPTIEALTEAFLNELFAA